MRDGKFIVIAWAAFLAGALATLLLSSFALLAPFQCVDGDQNCFREWVGALSGWAAALAAAATITVLVSQAAAAHRSVATAERALIAGTSSSERQLRAYVGIQGLEAVGFLRDEAAKLKVLLKNFGQTPAYGVSVRLNIAIQKTEGRVKPENGDTYALADLAPGQEANASFNLDGASIDDHWDALVEGVETLFCWLDINYADTFQHRRVTQVRVELMLTDHGERAAFGIGAGGTVFD